MSPKAYGIRIREGSNAAMWSLRFSMCSDRAPGGFSPSSWSLAVRTYQPVDAPTGCRGPHGRYEKAHSSSVCFRTPHHRSRRTDWYLPRRSLRRGHDGASLLLLFLKKDGRSSKNLRGRWKSHCEIDELFGFKREARSDDVTRATH